MENPQPANSYIADHKGTTYVIERARGARKLRASSMPTNGSAPDALIELDAVPYHIRRAARIHLRR